MYGTGGSRSGGDRSGDFVVAKVAGEELRISQLQEHLRSFVERRGIRDLSDKQLPLLYKAVFDEMVANRAVIDEVTRLKISAPVEEVNAQFKAIESQYVTKEAFMQAVKNQGQTMDQVKASIARELAINKMLEDVSGGVVVTDEEVQALYDALKANFTMPAGIEADFAYLKTNDAAQKFIADLKAGVDWDKAIEDAGEDLAQSSAADKPERIGNNEMIGKLEPITSLKDGEISSPIELSDEAYLVVRRVKAVEEETRPLSEVEETLRSMLLQSKKAEAQQQYIKELTDKMNIEILTPDIFEVPAGETDAEEAADEEITSENSEAPAEDATSAEGASAGSAEVKEEPTAETPADAAPETAPATEENAQQPAEKKE